MVWFSPERARGDQPLQVRYNAPRVRSEYARGRTGGAYAIYRAYARCGNPGRSLEATRRSFNKDFLLALATDFKRAQAIEKVRTQPAAYMKICALLVPPLQTQPRLQAIRRSSSQSAPIRCGSASSPASTVRAAISPASAFQRHRLGCQATRATARVGSQGHHHRRSAGHYP
jgi:hypothetical protein